MLIHRTNYETFFLLYADGELRADQRKLVEIFVLENEDLRVELNMLLAAVLPQEEIVFTDKNLLYKDVVLDTQLQERLLLKIDNELSASALASINNLLQTNEQLSKAYATLLRTKLDAADTIIFPHKNLLYKKEKDNIIPFNFIRWAVAAAIIGVGLFIGISFFNKNKTNTNEIVAIKNNSTLNKSMGMTANIDTVLIATAQTATKISNSYLVNPAQIQKRKESNSSVKKDPVNNSKENEIIKANNNKILELTLAKQQQQKLILQKGTTIENQQQLPVLALTKQSDKIKQVLVDQTIMPLDNSYSLSASFIEVEKSHNKILYMDEEDVKQSKVGGFFKKIKRMVERSTKIKSGNSISIGGFEVAAK